MGSTFQNMHNRDLNFALSFFFNLCPFTYFKDIVEDDEYCDTI